MKVFWAKLILFFALLAGVLAGVLALSCRPPWQELLGQLADAEVYGEDATGEILGHIASVQRPDEARRLIVGDSVCNQVFGPFRESNTLYKTEPGNAGVTMLGQYLLIREFLENHPDAERVVLCLSPDSLTRGLDHLNAYTYLVHPFARAGLLKDLSGEDLAGIRRACGPLADNQRLAELADRSGIITRLSRAWVLYNNHYTRQEAELAAVRALQAIDSLCAAHGVQFALICAPLADNEENRDRLERDAGLFMRCGIYERYESYFTRVYFYDPSLQADDGIHIAFELATVDRMRDMLCGLAELTGALDGYVMKTPWEE